MNEWTEESRLAGQKQHESDFELGARIAKEKGQHLDLHAFTTEVYNRFDYDRFDWEGGEFEMFKAILCVQHGYVQAGGTISFTGEESNEVSNM